MPRQNSTAPGMTGRSGAPALPDIPGWKNRFEIKSGSSDRVYIIAQSTSDNHIACSCPGFKIPKDGMRHCKHLKALNLPAYRVQNPGSSSGSTSHADFMKYKTHDGEIGDPAQWIAAFGNRFGVEESRRILGTANPYDVLSLPRTATFAEVQRAYVDLAKQHVPPNATRVITRNAATSATPAAITMAPRAILKFKKIQASFEIIEAASK